MSLVIHQIMRLGPYLRRPIHLKISLKIVHIVILGIAIFFKLIIPYKLQYHEIKGHQPTVQLSLSFLFNIQSGLTLP